MALSIKQMSQCSLLPVHEYWAVGCCLCPQMFSCSSPATAGLGGQEWVKKQDRREREKKQTHMG